MIKKTMAIKFFLVALITSSSAQGARPKLVNIEFRGEAFTKDQQSLITQSAEMVYKRIVEKKTTNCAYRNAKKGLPDRKDWETQIMTLARLIRENAPSRSKKTPSNLNLIVTGERFTTATLGRARIGSSADFYSTSLNEIHLKLNNGFVNIAYRDRKIKTSEDPLRQQYNVQEFWANVIAHELAHTLGLNHGTGRSWENDYKGYFITELGGCVMNNGLRGFSERF